MVYRQHEVGLGLRGTTTLCCIIASTNKQKTIMYFNYAPIVMSFLPRRDQRKQAEIRSTEGVFGWFSR